MQKCDLSEGNIKKASVAIRWGGGLFMVVFGIGFMSMPGTFALSMIKDFLASLKKGDANWMMLLPVAFLSIFVMAGISVMVQGVRLLASGRISRKDETIESMLSRKSETLPERSLPDEPPPKRKNEIGGKVFAVLFCSVFILIGAGLSYALTVKPLLAVQRSKGWDRAPAVVLSSSVKTHSDSDGDTYSVEIQYAYDVQQQHYEGNRYSFFGGSSNGYEGKEAVVNQYPPGRGFEVFYDPEKPSESVINRELTGTVWLGLIPLAFVAFGVLFLVAVLRGGRRKRMAWETGSVHDGPQVLQPGGGRFGKVIGLLFLGLFWNGIVSVFVVQMVTGWMSGRGEIGLTLFLIPFLLVGLGIIYGLLRSVMQLSNPRVIFTLERSPLVLGCETTARLHVNGARHRLRHLKIVLSGREEASYQRGTTTHTETHEFFEKVLLDQPLDGGVLPTAIPLAIPVGSMHSFEGSNNKVVWSLSVAGDIPRWPDVKDQYNLNVAPQRRGM
ncbi:MAG: DUF3592 domain-containing protein [Pontiellaceae bacterium]|nr:DUF3592 domain-containing protein [Pontiellaceae bacterium]MBN2784019.1 DUF3592 domain-containing protein [Pontiellaceae bacterium]